LEKRKVVKDTPMDSWAVLVTVTSILSYFFSSFLLWWPHEQASILKFDCFVST